MKIVAGQLRVIAGQPRVNIAAMKAMIDQVRSSADCIVFPEMCVGGYFLADRYNDTEYMAFLESFNDEIRSYSQDIIVIWGNMTSQSGLVGHDGRPVRFNSALAAYNGEWLERASGFEPGRYIKHLLPEYRVFDDERYFMSAQDYYRATGSETMAFLEPFSVHLPTGTLRLGIHLCEDLWSEDYQISPMAVSRQKGADFIVNLSSSPWTLNKEKSRHKRIKYHAQVLGSIPPYLYCNCAGMQNNGKNILMFDGGSTLYQSNGEIDDQAPQDFEAACYCFSTSKMEATTSSKLLDALIHAVRYVDDELFPFKPTWVIGLSGGLDSSVNAALLVLALGSERVLGVNMATHHNSSTTIDNAARLAAQLKIAYRQGSIEALVDSTHSTLAAYGIEEPDSLTQENIQARLRGHLLSSIASSVKGVIINNANKIETALGYATLYGDTIGALSVLGDCTKLQVVDLARMINARYEVPLIPENLLATVSDEGIQWQVAPSAELKSLQVDPMKWGYHDLLINRILEYPGYSIESLMQDYLDGRLLRSEYGRWIHFYQLTPKAFVDDLEWVLRTMQNAVFKRIQMPPIVMISRGVSGLISGKTSCV